MHRLARHLHHTFHQLRTARSIPLIPLLIAAFWLYTTYRGERTVFEAAIARCDWEQWEAWPQDAQPHRAVLVADPQLVDPHTYPGRPWPLSSLTERYTDRYMARSYRMINERHDPDSIIFLGDMLDGGREWAPGSAKALSKLQKWQLSKASPSTTEIPEGAIRVEIEDPGWRRPGEKSRTSGDNLAERDVEESDQTAPIDLTAFTHGENGRWKRYGDRQWESEYKRFGDIFLAPHQLYPDAQRFVEPFKNVQQSQTNIDNGARDSVKQHYAIVGTKTREVLASLPGNHDLGFGSGVQMPVRARYKWHFGSMNRVDVLGNHSFVSIDALSLAAWSQIESNGLETSQSSDARRLHLYAPTQQFINDLPASVQHASRLSLSRSFPETGYTSRRRKLQHTIEDTTPTNQSEVADELTTREASAEPFPLILLTHVPLYRDPDTPCGPLRERGHALSISGGYQYQNVLTRTLSETIVSKLELAGELKHVFSGDDHDYCNVTHTYASQSKQAMVDVQEETVKSFSWAMGVRRPGFHMASLWNPVDASGISLHQGATIQSHLCLLPDQLGIFIHYASMAGITVLILLIRAVVLALRGTQQPPSTGDDQTATPLLPTILPLSNTDGGSTPGKMPSKHRHRASSSGLKPISNGHLGVQRNANARARSVSPGAGLLQSAISPFSTPTKPLISQAGYYGPDSSDDEELRVGDMDYLDVGDSQAKWRRRGRPRGKMLRAFDEFAFSLGMVAGIATPFYIVLISRG